MPTVSSHPRIPPISPRERARSEPAPTPAKVDVLGELADRFESWDLNGNGQVSWSELRKNVADPEIGGKDALALATMYSLTTYDTDYRGLKTRPPVTLDKLYDNYYDYQDEQEVPVADSLYERYRLKQAKLVDELFPHDLPNGFLAKQGAAPSCGFLAATFAQAKENPEVLKDAVRQMDDGRIEVTFPGLERPVKIAPVTNTEAVLFSTAESNGEWLPTLEKAWGTHLSKGNALAAFEKDTYPADAIAAWANGKATTTRVPKTSKGYKQGHLPDFLKTTQRAVASSYFVVAWTRSEGVSDDGLVPGHAYTVTGVSAKEGTVSLRNPWGRKEPSDVRGDALDGRDDGLFSYSIADFQTNFEKIARQTA